MQTIFTSPEAWTGGSIDALMFFGKSSLVQAGAISRAIWSWPQIEGPYCDRSREPDFQERLDLSEFGRDGFGTLLGSLRTYDGYDVPFMQSTILDDEGLWVYAGPTVGGLPRLWDIGAYPLDDGKPIAWLPPLLRQLFDLSVHVHQSCPIIAATYGWLTLIDVDIVMNSASGRIPDERWAGICVWNGNESTYYPPTQGAAPVRIDKTIGNG